MRIEQLALRSLKSKEERDDDAPEGKYKRKLRVFYNACIKVDKEYQEQYFKETLRGLFSYIIFIALLFFIVSSFMFPHRFYYNRVLSRLFLASKGPDGRTFKEIHEVKHFWEYLKGPLLDNLYWDKWYNNEDLRQYNISGYILYQNTLLGLPQVRHARVESTACTPNKELEKMIPTCYGEYSISTEYDCPFGDGAQDPNATAWNHRTAEENHEYWFWGKLAWYSGGGYVQKLSRNRREAERQIDGLESRQWIRHGARAAFISFTVYNPNIKAFCVVRLVLEFPATGGTIPTWSFVTVPVYNGYDEHTLPDLLARLFFLAYLGFFILQEIVQVFFERGRYFMEFWNVFDILLVLTCCTGVALNVYFDHFVFIRTKELLLSGEVNYNKIAFFQELVLIVIALTAFIAVIKVFKFISFNRTLAQLSTTLNSCAKDLLGFFIMFFIVFLAFTQLGYLFFGSQTAEFSSFMDSFFTLFRIILGDFNFHQLEQVNRILGPIFFLLFVFFVFFVLINMFLAIINDTYSEVKSDMAKQTELVLMYDFLKQRAMALIKKLRGKKSETEDVDDTNDKAGFRKNVLVADWKVELQFKGFQLNDIQTVFLKYGVDMDGYIDSAGRQILLDELERRKAAHLQYIEQTEEDDGDVELSLSKDDSDDDAYAAPDLLKYKDFVNLFRRVDRLEASLKTLFFKTQALVTLFSQRQADAQYS